jgi:hypothetical protein
MTNGYPGEQGLTGCAKYHNLPIPYTVEKKHTIQQRASIGGYFSIDEQNEMLDYCYQDVKVTLDVFRVLCPNHPALWKEALRYGEYLKVVAKEEHRGIPVDQVRIVRLLAALPDITRYLVSTIPEETRFYDEEGHFSETAFTEYLIHHEIPWLPAEPPRKRTNRFGEPKQKRSARIKPALDAGSFSKMVKVYPQFGPLADVRYFLERMQVKYLPIGSDGRCRTLLWPASSDTLRNQPSSTKFLFGQPRWTRNFLKPPEGNSVVEVDIAQEEFFLAAISSGDEAMIADYKTGDAYTACAIRMGLTSEEDTEEERDQKRNIAKIVVLGSLYGLSAEGVAEQLGVPLAYARYYLDQLKRRYPVFFEWVNQVVMQAAIAGVMYNHFGWVRGNTRDINPRTLRNFPIQSAGSNLLQRVCVAADRKGVQLIGTVHDSFLLEAPITQAKDTAACLQQVIADITAETIGHPFRTGKPKIVNHPDHYTIKHKMWDRTRELYLYITGKPL